MAALSAATVLRESNGSLTLYKVTFASVTTAGDTWASGLGTNVIGYWANSTGGAIPTVAIDTGTSTSVVAVNGISVSESAGTFTLYPNKNGVAVTLNVWART